MKTTVNVNINKQAFVIDTDAYEILNQYLNNIRSRFTSDNEASEVMEDIEARIAELFMKKGNTQQVIDQAMVAEVIQRLGKPEDIFMEENDSDTSSKNQRNSFVERRMNRKLFRNPDDKKLSGLISGLSLYLGIQDVTISRIIFIASLLLLMLISKGSALFVVLVIYIILSLIIPLAKTASEKLQMRGEDANLNNITHNVMNDLSRPIRSSNYNNSTGTDINHVMKIILKVIVGIIVVKCIAFMLFLLFAFISGITISSLPFVTMFATSSIDLILGISGLLLFVITPCIAIVYYGLKWILNSKIQRSGVAWVLVALFISGIVLSGYEFFKQFKEWKYEKNISNEISLYQPTSDTIHIDANIMKSLHKQGTNINFGNIKIDGFEVINQSLYTDDVELDIEKGSKLQIIKKLYSRGSSDENSFDRLKNINYQYRTDSNKIQFDYFFSVPVSDKYRNQKVRLVLTVPVGKVVYLDRSTKNILYDIDNVTNTYDKDMLGHYWLMTEEGLRCIDKDFSDSDTDDTEEELKELGDSIHEKLKDAKDVNIEIKENSVSLHIDDEKGGKSKITIQDEGNDNANIKVQNKGKEEKIIEIKNNK